MKKVKQILNKLLKNKLFLIIGGAVILLLVLLVVLFITFTNKGNESKRLSSSLKELGISFYEDFYYKQVGTTDKEKKEFLEKYKDLGIKISLDSLSRHNKEKTEAIIAEFVNKKTDEECDRNNSMVVIYPRDPYGKKDYSIDAILVCGFEETETK